MWGIFRKILSVSQNIIMGLNNVMELSLGGVRVLRGPTAGTQLLLHVLSSHKVAPTERERREERAAASSSIHYSL